MLLWWHLPLQPSRVVRRGSHDILSVVSAVEVGDLRELISRKRTTLHPVAGNGVVTVESWLRQSLLLLPNLLWLTILRVELLLQLRAARTFIMYEIGLYMRL